MLAVSPNDTTRAEERFGISSTHHRFILNCNSILHDTFSVSCNNRTIAYGAIECMGAERMRERSSTRVKYRKPFFFSLCPPSVSSLPLISIFITRDRRKTIDDNPEIWSPVSLTTRGYSTRVQQDSVTLKRRTRGTT